MASKVTVTCELHGELRSMKHKGETYDELIRRLIEGYERYKDLCD